MHFENRGENSENTQFEMRRLPFQFRMWVIQGIYLQIQFGLQGLAIQIEMASFTYISQSVSMKRLKKDHDKMF